MQIPAGRTASNTRQKVYDLAVGAPCQKAFSRRVNKLTLNFAHLWKVHICLYVDKCLQRCVRTCVWICVFISYSWVQWSLRISRECVSYLMVEGFSYNLRNIIWIQDIFFYRILLYADYKCPLKDQIFNIIKKSGIFF